MVRGSSPRIAGAWEAWVLLDEAENDLAHLGPSREKDRASFTQVHLCSQHKRVDDFCDKMGNEPEEAQVGPCAAPPALPSVRVVGGFTVTVMMRVTARRPVLTLDKRTPVWQVSVQGGDTEAQGC